jgi:hypothetical protein
MIAWIIAELQSAAITHKLTCVESVVCSILFDSKLVCLLAESAVQLKDRQHKKAA